MPERVVLVHVERAGNAHGAARRGIRVKRLAVEQQGVFLGEDVGGLGLVGAMARALFAAVARDEATAAAKVVDGELAVVGAAAATRVALGHRERRNLVRRQDV